MNRFVSLTRPLAVAVVAITASATQHGPALAQDAIALNPVQTPGQALFLKAGNVDTSTAKPLTAARPRQASGSARVVLQLDGPMDPKRRARLEAAGVVLGDYLPANAYIARLDQADPQELAELDFVRWADSYRTEWKLDPEIGQRSFTSARRLELQRQGSCQVVVTLFDGEDLASAVGELRQAGATILGQTRLGAQWLIDATVPAGSMDHLAKVSSVQFVEEAPEGAPRNDTNRWIVQSNEVGQTPLWDAGLNGAGQIAGVIDGMVEEEHCDFDDTEPVGPTHRKIVAIRSGSPFADAHGTHVCGTIAGDSGTHGVPDQYDGIAYAARISFTRVNPIYTATSTLYDRLEDAHNDGARVHSNSWGDDGSTAYTTWCRQIDQFSYDYEENLVAFAVTNGLSLKTPENAKNVLAVGATQDTPDQGDHCRGGTGPTADGRRKPEVFAPGCATESAHWLTDCDVRISTGTSMACPVVAGAGVLVRQYFTEGYYPTGSPVAGHELVPSGALLKAVLINGTVDMTGISGYPSDEEGWGRLLLDNSVYLPGDTASLYVDDIRNASGLSTGEVVNYHVEVSGDSVPLRLTLVYTEPPASVGASDPVINNLDLEVTTPGGEVYKGNVFADGQSTTGGSFDERNNVEQVLRSAPAPGSYAVRVFGAAVNEGTQGYALVVTGDVAAAFADCNTNGVEDDQDITSGNSQDCNANGTPDECEAGPIDECPAGDCNFNGILDLDDVEDFGLCRSGPIEERAAGCDCADIDKDLDVDLSDFHTLQSIFGS